MVHIKRREDFFLQKVREGILTIDEKGHVYKEFDEFRGKAVHKRIDLLSNTGYMRVPYCKDLMHYECFAHRLVYASFHDIPDGMVINHKDGNKMNNHISNLEAVTPRQNTLHAMYVIGTKPHFGSRHPRAKLTPMDVERIFDLRSSGNNMQKIADKFKIFKSHVSRILKGQSWKVRQ